MSLINFSLQSILWVSVGSQAAFRVASQGHSLSNFLYNSPEEFTGVIDKSFSQLQSQWPDTVQPSTFLTSESISPEVSSSEQKIQDNFGEIFRIIFGSNQDSKKARDNFSSFYGVNGSLRQNIASQQLATQLSPSSLAPVTSSLDDEVDLDLSIDKVWPLMGGMIDYKNAWVSTNQDGKKTSSNLIGLSPELTPISDHKDPSVFARENQFINPLMAIAKRDNTNTPLFLEAKDKFDYHFYNSTSKRDPSSPIVVHDQIVKTQVGNEDNLIEFSTVDETESISTAYQSNNFSKVSYSEVMKKDKSPFAVKYNDKTFYTNALTVTFNIIQGIFSGAKWQYALFLLAFLMSLLAFILLLVPMLAPILEPISAFLTWVATVVVLPWASVAITTVAAFLSALASSVQFIASYVMLSSCVSVEAFGSFLLLALQTGFFGIITMISVFKKNAHQAAYSSKVNRKILFLIGPYYDFY